MSLPMSIGIQWCPCKGSCTSSHTEKVGLLFYFSLVCHIVSSLSGLVSKYAETFCLFVSSVQSIVSFWVASLLMVFSSLLKLIGVSLILVKLLFLSPLFFFLAASVFLTSLRPTSNLNLSSALGRKSLIQAGFLYDSFMSLTLDFL